MTQLEMIACKCCGEQMPKLRKELYGYDFCIKCSTVKPKVGRTLTLGQGDHTWNEIEILDQDTARKVIDMESNYRITRKPDAVDLLDYNQEDEFDDVIESTKDELKRSTLSYDPDEKKVKDQEEEEELELEVEDEDLEEEED